MIFRQILNRRRDREGDNGGHAPSATVREKQHVPSNSKRKIVQNPKLLAQTKMCCFGPPNALFNYFK